MAGTLAVQCAPVLRPAGLAELRHQPWIDGLLRQQLAHRKRPSGAAAAVGPTTTRVYTIPDKTANLSPAFNFMARHRVGKVQLSGNVYQRYIRTNTLNGDLNDDSLDQSVYQPSAAERAALTAAGYTGFPTSRRNGRQHAVSRNGDVSARRCCATSRGKNAMAC